MSDFVFPRARDRRRLQLRLAALAVAMVTAFAVASLWLGASFIGLVGGDLGATARIPTLGDSLGVNSSVKFRGIRVGRVVQTDSARDADGHYGARIVIDEEHAEGIPAGVRARILPGTLFGAEYVDLVVPAGTGPGLSRAAATGGGAALADGAVIPADTSAESIRLMDTFSAMQRVISAIDPAAIDLATSQLAGALDGKGDDLRRFIGRADRLVAGFAAAEPTFYRDLALLAENLETLADLEPGIAAALESSLPVARTIAGKARTIARLVTATTRLSAEVSAFLEQRGEQLTRFLHEVAPTYRAFVRGIEPFTEILRLAPAVLANGARAIKDGAVQMIALFGTERPGTYTAADCPRYESLRGRNCR